MGISRKWVATDRKLSLFSMDQQLVAPGKKDSRSSPQNLDS
jgi:hypothetical protein